MRVFAWGAPSGEQHLMCFHYVDLWLDQFGQVAGVEWTPVMSQHWWIDDPFGDGASPKEERSYDAVLFNGATKLEGFAGLNHAYYCQWAGLYTGNDAQHARRLWIDKGSPMPTLRLAYSPDSKRRLMRTGYIPPLNQAARYTVQHGETYEALGLNNHRAGINGTSGYQGRGILTNMDSIALIEQTAERWRAARVSAQASLSVFHHIKDHRPAAGGPFDGDASMGMFPQKIERLGAQTYPGLAVETIAVTGLNAEINDVAPSAATSSPHATGSFTAWDDAHHTVYAFMMAFVEGERYLADAVLDQLSHLNMQNAFDGFVSNPAVFWAVDAPRRDLLSVPLTPKYGFTHLRHRQERSFGWSQYSWDSVYALIADADRHKPFLANLQQNASDLLEDSIAFFPASQLETGTYWLRNTPILNQFMSSLSSMLIERSNILTEGAFPGHVQFVDLLARYLRDTLVHNPYASRFQNHLACVDDKNATEYVQRDERWVEAKAIIDNSGASGTVFVGNNVFFKGILPAEGDECYISNPTGTDPFPSELAASTIYYLVNVVPTGANDASWQLAETPGGIPLTVTSPANPSADPVRHYIKLSILSSLGFLEQNGAIVPADDDFMTIMNAAVEYHYGNAGKEISESDINQIRQFFAPKTYKNFANWNFNGDIMR